MTKKRNNINDLVLIGTAKLLITKALFEQEMDAEIRNAIKALGSLTLSRESARDTLEKYIANNLNKTVEGE